MEMKELKHVRPVITSIMMYEDHSNLHYSDSDAQTDYFHTSRARIAYAIEQLQKDAAERITINVVNNYNEPRYDKRVARFAKALNYKVQKKVWNTEYGEAIEYVIYDKDLEGRQ